MTFTCVQETLGAQLVHLYAATLELGEMAAAHAATQNYVMPQELNVRQALLRCGVC